MWHNLISSTNILLWRPIKQAEIRGEEGKGGVSGPERKSLHKSVHANNRSVIKSPPADTSGDGPYRFPSKVKAT